MPFCGGQRTAVENRLHGFLPTCLSHANGASARRVRFAVSARKNPVGRQAPHRPPPPPEGARRRRERPAHPTVAWFLPLSLVAGAVATPSQRRFLELSQDRGPAIPVGHHATQSINSQDSECMAFASATGPFGEPYERRRCLQTAMKPAAMKAAMRSLTAAKSSDRQSPPESLSMRPVRASVRSRAPDTKW